MTTLSAIEELIALCQMGGIRYETEPHGSDYPVRLWFDAPRQMCDDSSFPVDIPHHHFLYLSNDSALSALKSYKP